MADQNELQAVFVQMLLARVRNDMYPSATHMDMLEQTLPPDMLDDYIDVLFEKAFSTSSPSIPMLLRIRRLIMPA